MKDRTNALKSQQSSKINTYCTSLMKVKDDLNAGPITPYAFLTLVKRNLSDKLVLDK